MKNTMINKRSSRIIKTGAHTLFGVLFITILISGCNHDDKYLRYALKVAGNNRAQLEAVLEHYKTVDPDPEKLEAAKYLISNMPAHYSYKDTARINMYYAAALSIMKSGKSAQWQRDTICEISDRDFPDLDNRTVSDVRIMTSDYLIYSIDQAFKQWRTRPWAKHLTYDELRDWLLPYKVTELQSLDAWRDTLSNHFGDSIGRLPKDDERCHTIYGALDIVRNEMVWKLNPYIAWTTRSGYPLLSAQTLALMTYGSCLDYVNLGVMTFRSVGLPAVVDNVPLWGRNHEGHAWYTFLTDNGIQAHAQHDITISAGMGFFPYQRFPKIYRSTYAINRDRVKYRNKAKYVHPFNVCEQDVTDLYYRTSDVCVPVKKDVKLKDKYVYIATLTNSGGPQWFILDYGEIKRGKACFDKMGRELMYIALGYDGNGLVPITDPFIINKNGSLRYVQFDGSETRAIEVKRKYFESYNVVEQRRKILGARIQYAEHADFRDSVTLYTIKTTDIPDKIQLDNTSPHRYWRYLAADGTYGSIAELAFFNEQGLIMVGRPIACRNAGDDAIIRAYDFDWLSNFETDNPDGNWVGMDFGQPVSVSSVRVVPRSDDNDVCPGNEYELLYWNGEDWESLGHQVAQDNRLSFDNAPKNALMWLKNYTRGWAERPFLIDGDGNIEWW